jgi:hypothetical protein
MAADAPAASPTERARSLLASAAITHLLQRHQVLHSEVGRFKDAARYLAQAEEELTETERLLKLHGYEFPDEVASRKEAQAAAQAATPAGAAPGAAGREADPADANIAAAVDQHFAREGVRRGPTPTFTKLPQTEPKMPHDMPLEP